jgi:hypothetical protein
MIMGRHYSQVLYQKKKKKITNTIEKTPTIIISFNFEKKKKKKPDITKKLTIIFVK